MNYRKLALSLGSLALLAGQVAAGEVYRVGPTQPYHTVQAAIDAAADGDLLLVDYDVYPPFTLDGKALSILSTNSDFEVLTAPGRAAVEVRGIPAGRSASILGVVIRYAEPSTPAVSVHDNAGAVRFSRLVVSEDGPLLDAAAHAAIQVERTGTFWLAAANATPSGARPAANTTDPRGPNDGVSAVELVDTDAIVHEVVLHGYDNPIGRAGDGLRAIGDCSVWLRDEIVQATGLTTFRGGDGGPYGGHAVHLVLPDANENRITQCRQVRLLPGLGTVRDGGYYGINEANGYHPRTDSWRVPRLCNGYQVGETRTEETVRIGSELSVRVFTIVPATYVTVVSTGTLYTRVPRALDGRGLVDPQAMLFRTISAGFKSAATLQIQVPVPPDPALVGLQLSLQTAFGGGDRPIESLTGPSLCVVVP
jgi:hypothetical protein